MPETPVLERILFSQEQLADRVAELGRQISADYRGKTPLFVGILRGCILFYSDLMKNNNVNSDAQALNIKALEKLVNISPERWNDGERIIGLQIHFTDPVSLYKALEFIPNMVLSVQ